MNTATDNQSLDQNDGAIVEVKPDNALVVLNPQKYAEELFAPYGAQLTQAKRRAGKAAYDVATNEGKVALRAIIRSFVTIRTSSDKAKTEAKRPIDQAGKAILAVVAPIAAACKTEEEKYQQILDAQLAAEEAEKQRKIEAERVRVEQIENRIAHIRSLTATLAQASSEVVAAKLQELVEKQLDPAMYDEHLEDAVRALNNSIDGLREIHVLALEREQVARQAEADRAELVRLKAEQAERERVAAAEQATRDAQFQREREEAQERQRQFDAQQAAMQRQQQQMQDIMDMQALPQAVVEELGGRAEIEAAVKKARAFDPLQYGAMAAMAKMARDTALPVLEAMLAELPTPEVEAEPAPAVDAAGSKDDWTLPGGPRSDRPYPAATASMPADDSQIVNDEPFVQALLEAVRKLHTTRVSAGILLMVSDELDALDAGHGK